MVCEQIILPTPHSPDFHLRRYAAAARRCCLFIGSPPLNFDGKALTQGAGEGGPSAARLVCLNVPASGGLVHARATKPECPRRVGP